MRKRLVTKRNGVRFSTICALSHFSCPPHKWKSPDSIIQMRRTLSHRPHNVVHNKIVSCILPCKYFLELLKKWHLKAENIHCIIEDQAFVVLWSGFFILPSHPLPQQVVPHSHAVFLCVAGRAYWRETGRKGWSQIKRWRENMVICNTLNTLCLMASSCLLLTLARNSI